MHCKRSLEIQGDFNLAGLEMIVLKGNVTSIRSSNSDKKSYII